MNESDVRSKLPERSLGLYRIRDTYAGTLLYIGEGIIGSRLKAHSAKLRIEGHPQGVILREAGCLEFSWVINNSWANHHRLELENDLIASYILATKSIPAAQFLG